MGAILIVTYVSIAVFLLAVGVRFYRIASLPMHLRWELYPVAHEKKAHYGGSYLEEPEWWKKPRETSLFGEMKVMVPEILLLAGVWEHNKSQWVRSFPFHFGLYLLAGLMGLLLVGGIASKAGMTVTESAGGVGAIIYHLTYVLGYGGLALALLGSLLLLGRRTLNADYREYTKKGDFFNLVFFIATLGVALAAHARVDPAFAGLREFAGRLLTFDLSAASAATAWTSLQSAEVVLASILLAYIPLTHMSHFFTKWFMYHHIRWSDDPNLKGGPFEKKIGEMVQQPVSWAAPHIGADGKKTWLDVATADIKKKDDKEQKKS